MSTVSTGRKPSQRWLELSELLEPFGLTPGDYIRMLRTDGSSWEQIRQIMRLELCLADPPQGHTLQFWAEVEPVTAPGDLSGLIGGRRVLALSGRARQLRKEVGLSQQDVADYTGAQRATIGHYETGRRTPTGKAGRRYVLMLDALAKGEMPPVDP